MAGTVAERARMLRRERLEWIKEILKLIEGEKRIIVNKKEFYCEIASKFDIALRAAKELFEVASFEIKKEQEILDAKPEL